MTGMDDRLAELERRQRSHSEILAAMETAGANLAEQLAAVQLEVALSPDKVKMSMPKPTVRWWTGLTEEEIRAEVGRLRGWYTQVAEKWLGSTRLPDCMFTTTHGPVLQALDVAAAVWESIFLPERRSPQIAAAQADYLGRVLPALMQIIKAETVSCSCGWDATSGRLS